MTSIYYKGVAADRTRKLKDERQVLATLLTSVSGLDSSLNWDLLKQLSGFPVPPPQAPQLLALPEPPIPLLPPKVPELAVHIAEPFLPSWSRLERLAPFLRRKKLAEAEGITSDRMLEAESLNARERTKQELAAEDRRVAETEFERVKLAFEQKVSKTRSANDVLTSTHYLDVEGWHEAKRTFEEKQAAHNAEIDGKKTRFLSADPAAIDFYFNQVLKNSKYPKSFPREHDLLITAERTLIVDYELPSINALPRVKEVRYILSRSEFQDVPASEAWVKKTYDDLLYQVCLRTMYELFRADAIDVLRSVVFNGWVRSIDRATGSTVHACIMSLEAGKDEFLAINLSHVDPKTCFKKLKGVSASKLTELSPVKPLVILKKDDSRFVEGYAVADNLDERTNLAAMDWLDFENLIREVFEKEFSRGGGEVKITQASRDGGVDAVAFDPDPIRGGKLVIQAKRYTNTVGVSAVRDLYGTVHNEGANKGILVTTSDFGPDAYAFAKDKPLTLLSGAELLYLLSQHGHKAKIDLAEAKRMAAES